MGREDGQGPSTWGGEQTPGDRVTGEEGPLLREGGPGRLRGGCVPEERAGIPVSEGRAELRTVRESRAGKLEVQSHGLLSTRLWP